MDFNTIDNSFINQLKEIIGEGNVITEHDAMIDYSHDEFSEKKIRHFPEAVVKPRSTEEVAEIAKLCNNKMVPLTTRGAGTGLCGGCVPMFGGVVLSFENMNKVIEVDADNLTATAEAGVMLMDFYPAVEEKGLYFPPHPGDESATVGGVIATNAGGARAVKYGVIRNFIKGIEVVTASGDILKFGGKFIKDSSGYSLLNLMIGSEGTLGIVTKAVISLMPPPKSIMSLVVPFDTLHKAIAAVPVLIRNKYLPMAIEFVDMESVVISGDFIKKDWPCTRGKAHLLIIVDGSSEDEVMNMAEAMGELCLELEALDAFVADTDAKQHDILEVRSGIYEAMRNHMVEILDVTVPRSLIADYVHKVEELAVATGMWLPTYGHAGDGNVHTHIMKARWADGEWTEIDGWEDKVAEVRKTLHDLGKEYHGICSGEHGIGIVKKEYLKDFLAPEHINLMRGVKQVFDPKGILNPGKIFE